MTRIEAKAVFWDNDGVLVDTERLYLDATQRVLATIGISLTETDYLELQRALRRSAS
jgi:beta-phosphoglucomutase-like phosphatase (HAD superfamily)